MLTSCFGLVRPLGQVLHVLHGQRCSVQHATGYASGGNAYLEPSCKRSSRWHAAYTILRTAHDAAYIALYTTLQCKYCQRAYTAQPCRWTIANGVTPPHALLNGRIDGVHVGRLCAHGLKAMAMLAWVWILSTSTSSCEDTLLACERAPWQL